MWEKIVLNLISNAFKFTFEGQISVQLRQVGENAELRVADTGVGIPEEEIPNLFLRFHRIPNARSRTHEGSGIGLSLVHELIKLHRGTVRVESVAGKGSTFIVTIPLGQEHPTANQPAGDRPLSFAAARVTPYVQEAPRWLPAAEATEPEPEIASEIEMMGVPQRIAAPEPTTSGRPFVLVADDNADM